ncbi:MAG: hypothetical protein JOZ69_00615, partial [Myxococcales bacterium]|nr:hypothetical protein [Myxococcales bacterium]
PPWFKKQAQLVLQVGLNMQLPIPDLRLDDDGLSCTLSFNRSPFFCVVPWASVFAMVGDDGRGMVWPEDVPAEVARQAQRAVEPPPPPPKEPPKVAVAAVAREPKADPPKPKRARKRPPLAAVEGEASPESAAPKPRAAAAERPARTSPATAPRPVESPARASRGSVKKKRKELPPYLRVVK